MASYNDNSITIKSSISRETDVLGTSKLVTYTLVVTLHSLGHWPCQDMGTLVRLKQGYASTLLAGERDPSEIVPHCYLSGGVRGVVWNVQDA